MHSDESVVSKGVLTCRPVLDTGSIEEKIVVRYFGSSK